MNLPDDVAFYLPEEIAEYCRVPVTTVYSWIGQGRLEGKRYGAKIRIPKEAFKKFEKSTLD